ncbi:MAG: hypothetical protein HY902_13355 [Deltaproteobacteria bacterium]|nr:hypothetical protein [Deltaproteobacteria bacterium]
MNSKMLLRFPWFSPLAVAVLVATTWLSALPAALAATPSLIGVTGAISSSGGAAPDGAYDLTFALYKDQTGGTPLWFEGPQTIGVKNGMFSVHLGATKALPPAVMATATWVGVAIGQEPELPRKQLTSNPFAVRAMVAESLDCSGCVGLKHLAPDVASSFALATDLAQYAKVATLSDVASTGNFGDLKGVPVFPKVGKSCGTGLVMKGILADGSYECATSGISATGLPSDGLDEVSNGVLSTQFTDSFPGSANKPIPDGLGAGVTDTINVPSTGTTQQLWVAFTGTNSDLSKVKVDLYAPGNATPYVLYDGSKTGTSMTVNFNQELGLVSGDLNADWLGKDLKGTWSLVVRDVVDNLPAADDGKFTWSLKIQTNSKSKLAVSGAVAIAGNQSITGDLSVTGNLTVGASAQARLLFPPGSRPVLYGEYIDAMAGNALVGIKYDTAAAVPYSDNAALHNAVTQLYWADAKGNIQFMRGIGYTSSSTDHSRQYVVVFVKNPTGAAVTRNICALYSSMNATYGASLALNGTTVWALTTNTVNTNCQNVTFPANTSSTLVLKTAPYYLASTYNMHRLWAGFASGSLDLTGTGLEWDYDRYYAWMVGK